MKVAELISLLNRQDPDARVLLITQPDFVEEWSLDRVVTRKECEDLDDEELVEAMKLGEGDASLFEDRDVFLQAGECLFTAHWGG